MSLILLKISKKSISVQGWQGLQSAGETMVILEFRNTPKSEKTKHNSSSWKAAMLEVHNLRASHLCG